MKKIILCLLLAGCTHANHTETPPRGPSSAPAFAPLAASRMTEQDAETYCRKQNMHLPTTREFAAISQLHGAKGIVEISDAKETPKGYYRVDSLNPGDKADSFYFSHEGYNATEGGIRGEQLWTSSVVPDHSDFAHVFYGDWGGGGGNPQEHKRTFLNQVRCIL